MLNKVLFKDLALGARFRYIDAGEQVFVVLTKHARGLVTKYEPTGKADGMLQPTYGAFDTQEEFETSSVILVLDEELQEDRHVDQLVEASEAVAEEAHTRRLAEDRLNSAVGLLCEIRDKDQEAAAMLQELGVSVDDLAGSSDILNRIRALVGDGDAPPKTERDHLFDIYNAISRAKLAGFVPMVWQEPLKPLAMGHYITRVELRETAEIYKPRMAKEAEEKRLAFVAACGKALALHSDRMFYKAMTAREGEKFEGVDIDKAHEVRDGQEQG